MKKSEEKKILREYQKLLPDLQWDGDIQGIAILIGVRVIHQLSLNGCKYDIIKLHSEIVHAVLARKAENPKAFSPHDIDSELTIENNFVERYLNEAGCGSK